MTPALIHHSAGRAIRRKDADLWWDDQQIVAGMLARRRFGRRGVCVSVRCAGWLTDGSRDYYEATIGLPSGGGGYYPTRNIQFSILRCGDSEQVA